MAARQPGNQLLGDASATAPGVEHGLVAGEVEAGHDGLAPSGMRNATVAIGGAVPIRSGRAWLG